VTQFEYDAAGRLFRTVLPDGTSTTNYFDPAGQITFSTDQHGNSTFYSYEDLGSHLDIQHLNLCGRGLELGD
jgi:uncharacterized protein RhaS with RHS repeats